MIPLGLALELPAADGPNAVDDLVTRARAVADAGLASLWLGQVYDVDALTALALIGREVPRLALGTAVTTIHSRHPIAMSSQAQTTQAAVGGRLRLGLGVGHRATVEQRYGLRFDRPAHRMREYLAALRPLLDTGTVTFHGQEVTADTAGWSARVAGATPPPPLLLAALGPAMLRVCGELTDGTITWLAGPRTIAEHIVPALSAGAGGQHRDIVASLPICVTNAPDEARDRAATNLAFFEAVPSYRSVLDRENARSSADVAIVGDERAVEKELTRLADAGATHFVANLSGITTPEERTRTIALLGSLSARC
ncbi:Oxidoreductase [Frankia sp. AiPs1]|uniref:TIGR03564 family F420-dependent LLM class oxidoreductase n=1 Tax=Frankia sp. AiPa1 TaxID=573492 RepID=UPI00202B55AC|nr:TIGR03564 family F420-dependent LLM class oxidoreductase [Frankia sp. AiPa1]MCL9759856.1 TIGR03564 family F420-dependent LLM class oxidoreductase [Frankia sp. AiPa1]